MKRIMRLLTVTAVAVSAATASAADKVGVKVVADVAYVESGDERNKLDLYLPEGKTGVPVLVFFHGGGYTKGDRKDVAQLGQTFAKHGVAVAAVGYRLLSEKVKYPAPVEDGAKAVAWVKANAGKHGLAGDQLFVGGHSAGGHLASVLATDPARKLSDLRGVISLSGGYKIPAERASQYGGEDAAKQASPLTHVREGLPAFFLAYADKDSPNKDKQTAEFADALKGNKVPATVYQAKEREHGTLFTKIADGDPTGEAVLTFIREHAAKK